MRGQHRQLAVALRLFGDVRVEGEAADDQQVEADALHRLLGGLLDLLRADRAVLGADARRPRARVLPSPSVYSPAALNPAPGVGLQAVELEPLALARVLHARLAQVVEDHGGEVLPASCALPARSTVPF